MANYKEDILCNSILHGEAERADGTKLPWNHLCTLPVGHLGYHECWSQWCRNATWTQGEATGHAPFQKRKFTDVERRAIGVARSKTANDRTSAKRKAEQAADAQRC